MKFLLAIITALFLTVSASAYSNSDLDYFNGVFENYKPTNIDASSPAYYGFVGPEGEGVIIKETVSGAVTTYTYSKFSSDYSTNWTNRASLTYANYDGVF